MKATMNTTEPRTAPAIQYLAGLLVFVGELEEAEPSANL